MAITNLFVNVNAPSVSQGLVAGLNNNSPVSLPEFVLGDTKQYNLYFVDGLGNYATFSGSSAYTPFLAFGGCGQPTGGTFTLTSPNGAQTTAALAWNASVATVQAALQALTSIGAGNVLVTGTPGVYYVLQFQGALANQVVSPVTGSSALLTPASNLDISTTIPGSASPAVSCQQVVFLALNPLVLVSNWTPITNGWTGTLTANTVGLIAAFIGNNQALSDIFQITLQDPSSNMATYVQTGATAVCSIVNLHSFSAAVNPTFVTAAQLAAAVLGLANFTRQDISPTVAGNSNVIPQTTSRNHTALFFFSGAVAGIYTISIENGNSPSYGDQVWLTLLGAPVGLTIKIYNGSIAGTLLKTITTDGSGRGYAMRVGWNNSAWELDQDDANLMSIKQNLSGLASTLTSKANLKSLFNAFQNKTTNYSQIASDEGTILRCSAAAGSFVVTLLSAAAAGAGFIQAIQKTDSSAGFITTSPATATVNTQNQLLVIESDGTNWQIILNVGGVSAQPVAGQLATLSLPNVTQLVGGAANCLDAIATAGGVMQVGQIVEFAYLNGNGGPQLVLRYKWRAGTDAAAAMFVVRSVDFNAIGNAFVWELLSVSKQSWPCAFNADQSAFHQLTVSGAVGAEALSIGGAFTFT